MNKPEFYPYVLLPEEIEKIKIEGIPVPEIQELPPFPVKPKKKFLGTIILILSIAVIILVSLKIIYISYSYNNMITVFAFFVAIISLTATVFEILQNGKLKKQFKIAIKLYEELKLEREQIKEKRSKAIDDNNNPNAIESYRHDAISKYFRYSYNKIQAVQKEHSPAQNRFMVFLEQYFEGKILENIRIYHEPKELDYSPNFVIKLDNPKVNIAIDIEEPYLFDGTKVIVKKNRAEESFEKRFRITNELRWVSITFSEEQIVTNPMQACKLIAHTIDDILLKEKYALLFKSIEKIKRVEIPGQRELSAFIRNKHREKYLTAAGLVDGLFFGLTQTADSKEDAKSEEVKEKVTKEKIIKLPSITKEEVIPEKKKIIDLKTEETIETKKEKGKIIVYKETEKQESEVEQIQIVKKVTEKLRTEKLEKLEKENKEKVESEKVEGKIEKQEKIVETETEKTKLSDKKISSVTKKGQLRKEAEILNKLYANPENQNDVKEESEKVEKELAIEKEKAEQEFIEKERLEKEKQETERLEKVKLEKERLEKEKASKELLEKEKLVQEREEKKRLEQEQLEKEKVKKEQVEKELAEQKRLEEEQIAKEKVKNEKLELERIEKELAEKKRLQEEQLAKEKLAQEKREQERLEKEQLEKEAQLAKEKAEKEQLEKMIAEKKRLEEEQLEKIRQEKEKLELEKLQKELDKKAEIEANNQLMEQHKVQIETLVNNQEWEKLFDKCNQIISELPYWAWPYYRRSTVHGNQGKFDEVLEDCNKALALNPKLSDAYYNRATAKFFMEKYQDAADDYQKCIDLKYENSANAYFNKGLCFQNMNYQKKAYREFLKAKDLGSSKAADIINKQYNNDGTPKSR